MTVFVAKRLRKLQRSDVNLCAVSLTSNSKVSNAIQHVALNENNRYSIRFDLERKRRTYGHR